MPCYSLTLMCHLSTYVLHMTIATAPITGADWYDNLSDQDRDLYDMIEDRCPEFTKLDADQCQEFLISFMWQIIKGSDSSLDI